MWKAIGPGVITGAANDDPSGIATYSVAGAQFGTAFLWTALVTWPLMGVVQNMCARIGMVTGRGLMGALRERIPRPLLLNGVLFFASNQRLMAGQPSSRLSQAIVLATTIAMLGAAVGMFVF